MRKIIVVGDQFGFFANGDDVITLSHYESHRNDSSICDAEIIAGLGMHHDKYMELYGKGASE